jgi:DNA-binding NtrC family response regulator
MSAQVLVVSRDEMLLKTRQLLLGTFFEVKVAGRIREAEAVISSQHFDLIVLCYTLSEDECAQVIDLIANQRPRPKVLILTAAGSRRMQEPGGQFAMTESGPYPLLKKAAELLGIDLREKSRLIPA